MSCSYPIHHSRLTIHPRQPFALLYNQCPITCFFAPSNEEPRTKHEERFCFFITYALSLMPERSDPMNEAPRTRHEERLCFFYSPFTGLSQSSPLLPARESPTPKVSSISYRWGLIHFYVDMEEEKRENITRFGLVDQHWRSSRASLVPVITNDFFSEI